MDFISLGCVADKVLLGFIGNPPNPSKALKFKDTEGKEIAQQEIVKLLLKESKEILFLVRGLSLEDLAGSLIVEIVKQNIETPEIIWRSIDKVISNCRACIVEKELILANCSHEIKENNVIFVEEI